MSERHTESSWTPNRIVLRRLLRYREWLLAGRGFTMQQAVEELEVCQRTVYRDMDYVRTLGWDVEFCRRRRIASQQFYWWQRQLLDRDGNGSKAEGSSRPASFVPVRVVLSSPAIELVHPSGCLIRVAAGAETSTLRSVLKALSASEE